MGKYVLYSHAGSENHGCEALLRTSVMTIPDIDTVYTGDVEADRKYGLDRLASLKKDKSDSFDNPFSKLLYSIRYHFTRDDRLFFRNLYRGFIRDIDPEKVYISIGGDNYCYHFSEWLEVLNTAITKKGAKSVLWGCSINRDELENKSVIEDLKRYSLITARESITYTDLREALPNQNIQYIPDTAFLLPVEKKELPKGFVAGKTIGLNVSPVATENAGAGEGLLEFIVELTDYIIDNTDYQIALIPHVVIKGNDDRETLKKIQNRCKSPDRTALIADDNCMAIKWYISQCELFIGARTHATIAAYSSFVPTLVLGYSVKARGIAKDLFGTDENYVMPVQKIHASEELIKGFCWLNDNKMGIRQHLINTIPGYVSQIENGVKYLEKI